MNIILPLMYSINGIFA